MPIVDIRTPVNELKRIARQYDVDSLYTDLNDGPVGDLLQKPGLRWAGRGRWGPFGEEARFRKGLLPTRALIDASADLILPIWARDDPADLALAATWGLTERLALPLATAPNAIGPRTLPIAQLLATIPSSGPVIGALEATTAHLEVRPRAYLDGHTGIYVMRPNHPQDVVEFWNMRLYGMRVIGVPAEHADGVVAFLLSNQLPHTEIRQGAGTGTPERVVRVWGLGDASSSTAGVIRAAANRDDLRVWPQERGGIPRYIFQGLGTRFTRSIRVDFRPEARWVDIALPVLTITHEPDSLARGVIAAEVKWHSVVGQDPRMTTTLPPFPQEASLLQHVAVADGVDHTRVTHDGLALGIDVERDHVCVPFALNQDAVRLLFDDDAVTVTQSDVGRFQARAAQKFGGPFTGSFNQPGVRDAITLAADRRSGVTLPHLRRAVERGQGEWPDPLFGPKLEPKDYAKQEINFLFHSGLFVPTLRVHCSYCRVERHIASDDLAATMTCEFCGETFNLALSHSLTPPEWRYRLAAHLGPDQVQALLPALAAAALLRQFRHVEEPPLTHVLGLEVTLEKRTIEVDLAAYIPDHDWTLVLAEVKTGNRIDANDIANLEFLRQRLADADVRCLLMFVTLKDRFSPEETTELRALAERSPIVRLARGYSSVANLPLVLTGPDLSHPPGSENHPWRWEDPSYSGLFGTALGSCQRNLGLKGYRFDPASDTERIVCEWEAAD